MTIAIHRLRSGDRQPPPPVGRPSAPDLLVHLHIAKTGGTSLSSMVKHGFVSDEVFEWTRHGVDSYTALGVANYADVSGNSELRAKPYPLH